MNKSEITINQLTHCYKEIVAVDALSLEVRKGEIFGFLGHDGAGKNTTVGVNKQKYGIGTVF